MRWMVLIAGLLACSGLALDHQGLPIPEGFYRMGDTQGRYDERPVRSVKLDAFLIDRCEVSNRQFALFVRSSGYQPQGPWRRGYAPSMGDHPVRYVSWNDAKAYADWAGRRLPSEAEWEAAAGTDRYSTGSLWKPGAIVAELPCQRGPSTVDGGRDRSSWGVLNLGGNVREWVNDWYDRYAYATTSSDSLSNPRGPADGTPPEERFVAAGNAAGNERSTRKVVRGGSWASSRDDCRRSRRDAHNPDQWYNDVGFRCAVSR